MSVRLLVQLVGFALALSGCARDTTLAQSDIRPLHYSTGKLELKRVDGLRQALQASPDAPVRVIAVHGMITNEPRFSQELQANLAARLGLSVGRDSGQIELTRGYEFVPAYGPQPFGGVSRLPRSQLRRTAWTARSGDGLNVERLVFYELLWAPLRDQVKDSFVGCFERGESGQRDLCKRFSESRSNNDRRLPINRGLKESITLGGFADATLILGPIGDVIRDDLTLALCVVGSEFVQPDRNALADATRERCNLASAVRRLQRVDEAASKLQRAKFMAVTHSLGSFLFMDAQHAFVAAQGLAEQSTSVNPAGQCSGDTQLCDEVVQAALLFLMTDQATVFMNANQISLLSLARLASAGCSPVQGTMCPNPYLRGRSGQNEPWRQSFGMPRMTTFVAFNDTNDLLSFELPPFLADTDGNSYVNVSVRNPAFSLPWLFKNPATAHTSQAKNPAVIDAIAEGFAVPQ